GLILFSQCRNLTQFYLAAALVGLGGAGTYLVPVSFLITQWFQEKRGLAMGIALTGSGVGGMICGPLSNWLIMTSSWQMALVVLGIISLAIIIPFSLFIVRLTPSEMGLLPYGCLGSHQEEEGRAESGLSLRQAVKTSSFWLLGLAFIIIGILIMGVQMHIPGYLENVGHTSTFAAYVVGFTNGLLILGKPMLGGIHDKFGTKAGAVYIFIIYIITLAALIGAKSTLVAGLFTVLFGFAAAIATLTIPLWTLEVLGKKEFVTIYPIMNIFFTLGAAVGSPLTGLVFDAQGSYLYAWVIYIGLSVVGLMLALAAYSRRQVDTAEEVALNNPGNLQY
ncbi:MAG: MFS transporter, partial [Chitinophagales bacterium]